MRATTPTPTSSGRDPEIANHAPPAFFKLREPFGPRRLERLEAHG
jgi:hypothetical protein